LNDPQATRQSIKKFYEPGQRLDVVDFLTIEGTLAGLEVRDLTTEQMYLFEMCRSIKDGDRSPDLARRNPGSFRIPAG